MRQKGGDAFLRGFVRLPLIGSDILLTLKNGGIFKSILIKFNENENVAFIQKLGWCAALNSFLINLDVLVKNHFTCHCEERSDEAIP